MSLNLSRSSHNLKTSNNNSSQSKWSLISKARKCLRHVVTSPNSRATNRSRDQLPRGVTLLAMKAALRIKTLTHANTLTKAISSSVQWRQVLIRMREDSSSYHLMLSNSNSEDLLTQWKDRHLSRRKVPYRANNSSSFSKETCLPRWGRSSRNKEDPLLTKWKLTRLHLKYSHIIKFSIHSSKFRRQGKIQPHLKKTMLLWLMVVMICQDQVTSKTIVGMRIRLERWRTSLLKLAKMFQSSR